MPHRGRRFLTAAPGRGLSGSADSEATRGKADENTGRQPSVQGGEAVSWVLRLTDDHVVLRRTGRERVVGIRELEQPDTGGRPVPARDVVEYAIAEDAWMAMPSP